MPLPENIRKVIEDKNPTKTTLYAASWRPSLTAEDMSELVDLMAQNPYLTTLTLNENEIEDKGCQELQQIKTVTHLEVAENGLGDDGAIALSKMPQLQELVIPCNDITDKGFLELVHKPELTSLSIAYNKISDVAANQLFQIQDSHLVYIDLKGNLDIKQTTLDKITAWLQSNKTRLEQNNKTQTIDTINHTQCLPQLAFFSSPPTKTKYDIAIEQLSELPLNGQLYYVLQLINTWPNTNKDTLKQRLESPLLNTVPDGTTVNTF
jgi:Leucine-rich repeat (LRR) protein